MTGLGELKETLTAYLAPRFAGQAAVAGQFPDGYMQHPLSGAVIAVGLEEVRATNLPGGYAGADGQGELYGRALEVTLRFDILRPDKAELCHSLFEGLCAALLDAACPVSIQQLGCGALAHHPAAGGFVLTARASTRLLDVREQPTAEILDFRVERAKDEGE